MAELLQREQQYTPLWIQCGRHLNFHRWAGLSGALAFIFTIYSEYGDHYERDRHMVSLANRIHYIHTLALLAIPLARRPFLSGISFLIGTFIFSFGCYFCAISGINAYSYFVSIGSMILITTWLTFMF